MLPNTAMRCTQICVYNFDRPRKLDAKANMKKGVPINRFHYEQMLARTGVTLIAGVDEAGRGPLAGPVLAAAVILPAAWYEAGPPEELKSLNDSKQLTEAKREAFYVSITSLPGIYYGIAQLDAPVIDSLNILRATHQAMQQALDQLKPAPAHILVDGTRVKTLTYPQTSIVKGDSLSYSIAAASILAKVTRDRLMLEYHTQYPEYGFAEHKGYGTAQHLAAIERHGPCPIHRRSFAPLRKPEPELF